VSVHWLMRRVYWVLQSQIGVDPIKAARVLRGVPPFVRDWMRFRAEYGGEMRLLPCLHDWRDEAGEIRHEYFWQDLLVARLIFQANPRKHVDVGSRIDGFIAHVASFREIEVLDIRPLSKAIPGVVFRQVDILNLPEDLRGYCDSLSCLHALEHIGLGRYGDPIDPRGSEKAFKNLARMLELGGTFYLAVPCGRERVEFNGHWVFSVETISRWASGCALKMKSISVIDHEGVLTEADSSEKIAQLLSGRDSYKLCLFVFEKAA
jgi:SAM-dependent methyltransferase